MSGSQGDGFYDSNGVWQPVIGVDGAQNSPNPSLLNPLDAIDPYGTTGGGNAGSGDATTNAAQNFSSTGWIAGIENWAGNIAFRAALIIMGLALVILGIIFALEQTGSSNSKGSATKIVPVPV